MGLRTPIGRTAFQFWSFPIKQTEFLIWLAKNDPKKLIYYLALAEGGNLTLQELLNIDLSNALGVGMNWGEALNAIKAVPEGDWRKVWRHTRLSYKKGGGLLPSGPGPTATGVYNVIDKLGEGKGWEQFKKELTPVQLKRFGKFYQSLTGEKRGKLYPVYDSKDHLMYHVTTPELVMRTFGPRPARESKEFDDWQKANLLEEERVEVLKDIVNAIIDDNKEKANKLINKYQIVPTAEQIENEILKRKLTYKERKTTIGKREEYQYQREGEIYGF